MCKIFFRCAALLVIVGMMAPIVGCSQKSQTVKLGIPVPMSGDFAVYGELMKEGTDLAVSEINAAGGILGRKVEAIYQDDQSTPRGAMDKVTSLIETDKVDAIIGLIGSDQRDAVIPVITRAKKLFIYPTTYEGGVAARFQGKGANYVFTTGPVSEQYIKPVIPWLVKNKGKSMYFLGMDYIYGRGAVANAKKYLVQAGGTVVGEEYIPLGTTDFSAVLNRIAAKKPDVVFAVEAGDDLIYLAKQFYEFGLKAKGMTLATSELDESYFSALGPDVAAGIVCSYPYFMGAQTPENANFLKSMRDNYGKDIIVTLATEAQYYSVWMYAKAAEKAKSVDTDAVIAALEGLSFDAPEGPITIRKQDHQAIVGDLIAVVKPDTTKPYYDWLSIVEQHVAIEPEMQGNIYGN